MQPEKSVTVSRTARKPVKPRIQMILQEVTERTEKNILQKETKGTKTEFKPRMARIKAILQRGTKGLDIEEPLTAKCDSNR